MTAALVLFAFGGVIGFFEGSVDTRTPAHYHAMLIAVTLAFMTLYFGLFLPLTGRRTARRRLRTAMYLLFGAGQFLHSIGLYIAGLEGVGRKIAGAAQDLDSTAKRIAMATEGIGGVIAVVGGIIFIVLAARMVLASLLTVLRHRPEGHASNRRMNVRELPRADEAPHRLPHRAQRDGGLCGGGAPRGCAAARWLFVALLLGSSGSAVFNQFYDRDIDGLMPRTSGRPLVVGTAGDARCALWFAGTLLVAGCALAILAFNWSSPCTCFSVHLYMASSSRCG